ncbi:hypothetical protein D3C76_953900 [compost metagenome]
MHLFNIGIHRAVQVAGVFHHLAAQAFALLLALVQALVRLANLRAGQATAVDRDVQLQADAGLLNVTAVTHGGKCGRVGEAKAVIVAFLVLGHGIDGRGMAGLALAQGFLGRVDREVVRQQVEVLPRRSIDPGLGIVGRRHLDRQGVDHALDRGVFAVGQRYQRLEGILHLAFGDDPVGPGGIVAGLGLQDVGLVGKTDVEALVGLVQLALERLLLGLGRGEVVLGPEHGEVILCRLQDQVLLGGRKLQCRLFVDGLGGL